MALIAGQEFEPLPDGPDGTGFAQGGFYRASDGPEYQEGYDDGFEAGETSGYAAGYAAGLGAATVMPPGTYLGYLGGYLGAALVDVDDDVEAPPVAVPAVYTPADPEYVDHVELALSRLCQFCKPE